MDKKNILIVDDDPRLRKTLSDVFKAKGYTPITAAEGKEALDKVREEGPALALIDLKLEDMSGLEVIRGIKEYSPGTECIVITGHASQESAIEAVNLGAYSYVRKPYDIEQLLLAVQRAIEKQEAEKALRESEEKYREVVETSVDGVISIDSQMKVMVWNRGAERIFGYTEEEIPGQSVMRIVPERYRKEMEKGFVAFRKSGAGPVIGKPLEFQGLRKDGTEIPVELSVSSRKKNETYIATAIVRDITERRQAAAAKTATDTIEGMADGLLLATLDGKITFVNPAFEGMSGYKQDELVGRDIAYLMQELVKPEDLEKIMEGIGAALAGEVLIPIATALVSKDGREIPITITVSFIRDAKGQSSTVIVAFKDITELKRTEAALERQTRELARSNTELAQFAYIVSHDLQEPLHIITNYLQLLERQYKERLDAKGVGFIARTVAGAVRMQTLINDLLDYSRVGTHGKPFESTNCESIIGNVLADLKVAVEESGAMVTTDPLPTVPADPTQLNQLFQNLLGNAIKFRGPDPPCIHISAKKIEKSTTPDPQAAIEEGWLFSVRDNGIGIKPEYADRIFVVFQRLHTRSEYPGTGIGLAICRKVVQQHGGKIWVESEPGKGTTFYFTIPEKGGLKNEQIQ